MKVTSVEAFPVRAENRPGEVYWGAATWSARSGQQLASYPPTARRRYVYSNAIETTLVRIETDEGIVGWGECKAPVAPLVTATIVRELLASLVVGSDLADIAVTWERMYAGMRVRGHDSGFWLEALAGVDIALWDAWGHALGQPVSALLGGRFRNTVPVYASGIPAASSETGSQGLDRVRRHAEDLRTQGWNAVKVAIGVDPRGDLASVAAIREVFGSDAAIYADAAGAYDVRQARSVGHGLQDLGVGFFEMPIAPEHLAGYAELATALDIPLALDSLPSRHRALEFLRAGALHVLQPDVCRAGGITETMRIATLADAFGAQATPHVSIGSAIHFAASLQCALATPNLAVMEHWVGNNPLGHAVAPDLDTPDQGVRRPPEASGLGIHIEEATVRKLSQ